jgi:hypothetical protein
MASAPAPLEVERVVRDEPVAAELQADPELFDCARTAPRDPRETRGLDSDESRRPDSDGCGPQGCC